MCARSKIPFEYGNKVKFPNKLTQWIDHVFYDVLPEQGYEVREEQIYTAFQIANAMCKGKVHFAEAGLGTGKTFAYLLTAVSYARFSGKPVVIACASTALQEQLAGSNGDIDTLSRLLDLDIDSRMAKDPRQYLCDIKVSHFTNRFMEKESKVYKKVLRWTKNTHRGERSEMPQIPDGMWKKVAWDETMPCELCSRRGFCKLVKAREHYRTAQDLIIADHGTFFDDLWTRDEQLADGKLPLLPPYSAVLFDEGHQIMLPAAMSAVRQISKKDLKRMVSTIGRVQGARPSLISIAVALGLAVSKFFNTLHQSVIQDEQTERLALQITDELLETAHTLRRALETLQLEMLYEQELHIEFIFTSQLQTYEARVERAMVALNQFCRNKGKDIITWVDRVDGSLWVVPQDLRRQLNDTLFAKRLPVVFSSATLSIGGDFSYLSRTLGLTEPSGSSAEGFFDYQNQVVVYLPENLPHRDRENRFSLSISLLVSVLRQTGGRGLVLANSPSEVGRIRMALKEYQFPFELLWEDRGERGHLVRRFREEVSSVLIGSGFWEGIDVPGEALSLLVIWQLPFPSSDPLIEVRRREAKDQGMDPLISVDFPEMGLKLKQGCGRLIRTKDDRGAIVIMEPVTGMPWEKVVMEALPPGAQVSKNWQQLQKSITTLK
jgi:ATP-dependent DNA helicase DinG